MNPHILHGKGVSSGDEIGRLYASAACPFSHRVLAALSVTGLTSKLAITWMQTVKSKAGWMIAPGPDPLFGQATMRGIYQKAAAEQDSRPSVPLLVDPVTQRIISSESSEITHIVARGFCGQFKTQHDLCPPVLEAEISALNTWLHQSICRAVYRVGFTTTQTDYDNEVELLFNALDKMEKCLEHQSFLFGNGLTESDLYFFATLARFDAVYGPLFKCSLRTIASYPALSRYLAELINIPVLARTVDLKETVHHYYGSVIHTKQGTRVLNASGVIPATPIQEYLMSGGQQLEKRHLIVHSE